MSWVAIGLALMAFAGQAHAVTAAAGLDSVEAWKLLLGIALGGILISLGKLLASQEPLTWRLVIGRALVSSALSVGSAALLLLIPGMPFLGLVGLASLFAVLGEQFVERIINARLGGGPTP